MTQSFSDLQRILSSLEDNDAVDGLTGKTIAESQGRQLLITTIPGNGPALLIFPTSEQSKTLKKISLRGVEIRNVKASINGEPELEYLGVLCRDSSPRFREPFLRFTEDLCLNFDDPKSDTVSILRTVLNKWRLFWAPVEHEITEDWIKGLWGELSLLESFIDQLRPSVLVNWTGPEGMDHDFQGGNIGIEAKTTETMPPVMTVNNLRQLDSTLFESLFIAVSLVTRSEKGLTLDQLVERIARKLKSDHDLSEIFLRKIASAGYRPHHVEFYQTLRLTLVRPALWYRVDSLFPALTGRSFTQPLDARIREVRYRLELTNLTEANQSEVTSALMKMSGIN